MWKALTADSIFPYALLGMTAVTGLVDAVSFLSLGHVFTANMTGNIVLLAFASTGVPQVSLAGSITALLVFLAGAAVGGRIMAGASAVVQLRAASSVFALEIVFLVGATLAALGYRVVSSPHFLCFVPEPVPENYAEPDGYNLGSTGSLSNARTPKTHS